MQQEILINSSLAPTLKRRLICMIYEALLVFGIIFVAVLVFDAATQNIRTIDLHYFREIWIFAIVGLYFVFFWVRTGQTLAMKTWRIRVEDKEKRQLPLTRAIVRYCLAWMWFLPGLALSAQYKLSPLNSLIIVSIGFLLWALTATFDSDKQFFHDKLAKTRLVLVTVDLPPKI
ncbi:MAG: RDD family protein [Cytophaga sp.]|nr:RDD family protein [Undibacterium sp.]